MRDDSDPEKWQMKGQTEIKHRILEKYLHPWFNKITTQSSEIHYIDGFAGRGEYEDESQGSPLIAMDVAARKLANEERFRSKLDHFRCFAVERNPENYSNLSACIETKNDEVDSRIEGIPIKGEFGSEARTYISNNESSPQPCFVFIDPFGFRGVPLEVVSELVNLRATGVEVFITFMSGKMAQFLTSRTHQVAMDEVFGTPDWRDNIDFDAGKETKAEQLMLFYEKQLREEAAIDFVWPFQMYEENKVQTSYYLIHATNHYDGFELMKDIMFSEGADEKFAYLGPEHYPYKADQADIFTFSDDTDENQTDRVQTLLKSRYSGERIRFEDLLREQYTKTPFISTQFREACKELANTNDAQIFNFSERENGRSYGLGRDDEIEFYKTEQSSLGNY